MKKQEIIKEKLSLRKWFSAEKIQEIKSSFSFIRDNKKVLIFLIIVYTVALIPLFRANFNYRDDGGRVLAGFDDWDNFGRITTNSLSHVVHADEYIRDISPLPQILAVLIIVIASVALLWVVRGNKKLSLLDGICVLPLGLFPYYLCCFSYKFDAPYMALSVLVSIFPFVFRHKGKAFYIIAFFCTFLMCTTYQASAGLFPMLVVFTAFLDWKDGEKAGRIVRYCLLSAIAYIAAMLIFFFFIPKGDNGYVAEKVSFSALSIKRIIDNYITYFATFKSDFRVTKWFAIIAIISVMFFVRNNMESKRKWYWTLFASGVVYAVILLLSFGVYPLLDEPFLMPRGMYGLCMFIALICLGATPTYEKKEKRLNAKSVTQAVSWVGVIVLSWLCVVFTCTYGNALSAQKSYDEFRVAEVATELAGLPALNGEKPAEIQVVGTVGYAAGIKNIPGDRLLLRLVPPPFGGENYWSYLKLLSYYGLPQMEYTDELSKENYTEWDIAHENCYHTIYTTGDKVVVELEE